MKLHNIFYKIENINYIFLISMLKPECYIYEVEPNEFFFLF